MKLQLNAEYLLSKPLTGGGVQKIKKYLAEETKEILVKGVPKDKLSK